MSTEPNPEKDTNDTKPAPPANAATIVSVYDDDLIEEDNALPNWWLYTLFGTIVFGVGYFYGQHKLNLWPSQEEAYQAEMAQVRMEAAKKGGAVTADMLVGLSKNPATVAQGKEAFTTTCASCHRADGGGQIGPNLTDAAWIHGSDPVTIWKTVREGITTKGMPGWGPQLGEERVAAVAAYVLTIQNTHVLDGKAPQGPIVEKGPVAGEAPVPEAAGSARP
jgi:cytochrome c oxidase cbb3-type subunit 3